MFIRFCTALLFHVLSSTVLLFDVFYGLYSGGVSVLSDVASCFVFYSFCCFMCFMECI